MFTLLMALFLVAGASGLRLDFLTQPNKGSTVSKMIKVPLVTGSGGSSLHAVARYLNEIGIPAVHEGIAPHAVSVSWPLAAFAEQPHSMFRIQEPFNRMVRKGWQLRNTIYKKWLPEMAGDAVAQKSLARCRENNLDQAVTYEFEPRVQLVHEPLAEITSLATCFCTNGAPESLADRLSWEFAEEQLGRLGKTRLKRAANYWLKWYQLGRSHATATLRIEDATAEHLLEALGQGHNMTLPNLQTTIPGQSIEKKGIASEALSWKQLCKEIGSRLCRRIKRTAEFLGYSYSD